MFSKDIDVLDYAICYRYGLTAETSGMNRMMAQRKKKLEEGLVKKVKTVLEKRKNLNKRP